MVGTAWLPREPPYESPCGCTEADSQATAALSADGRLVIVAIRHSNEFDVADPHVRLFGFGEDRPLADLGRALFVGEAPRGQLLFLTRDKLLRADSAGRITETPLTARLPELPHYARPVVSADGKLIALTVVYSRYESGKEGEDLDQIYLVEIAHGRVRELDEPIAPPTLLFSSDGATLFASHRWGAFRALDVASGRTLYTGH